MNENTTILLIEDNDDHAELAEFFINEYDATLKVVRLADGALAMEYLAQIRDHQQRLPWLSLLDLKLPKYDGHEILTVIKSDETLAKMPVVIFTTSASVKDITKAIEKQANSYITKPMDFNRYGEVIANILSYWQLNQHVLVIDQF